jgi:ectoine hydroxylase
MPTALSADEIRRYHEDGLVIRRKLFDAEEVALLRRAMEEDPAVRGSILDRLDGEGRSTKIALWNRAGDSVYGLAARVPRMVDTSAGLIGEDVYHFQSKLTAKEPEVGGAWEWHQDYGYWYYNGCLEPSMLSVMIALDPTTKENGCLQLVKGSHKMGRIDHVPLTQGQNEADPRRMEQILAKREVEYAVMEPGDALFFHCNTLHRSDANRSASRRWTLLICYNAISNDALKREDDRSFVPLHKVDNDAIKRAGLKFAGADNAEHFASRPYVPDVTKLASRDKAA